MVQAGAVVMGGFEVAPGRYSNRVPAIVHYTIIHSWSNLGEIRCGICVCLRKGRKFIISVVSIYLSF